MKRLLTLLALNTHEPLKKNKKHWVAFTGYESPDAPYCDEYLTAFLLLSSALCYTMCVCVCLHLQEEEIQTETENSKMAVVSSLRDS